MKVKNQYLKKFEYLHLSFNTWPSIQYTFCVSLVLWNHNNGEHCWLGNVPEDDHWHPPQRGSLLKGVAVQGVLYQSILNEKFTGRKKLGRKMFTSNRDDRKLENTVKKSQFKHLGELSDSDSGLAWPEPHRESMGYCQEEDERHPTQQCSWPEGRYQSNLGFITPEQCHRLIASLHWCSNSCKRRHNQVLSA